MGKLAGIKGKSPEAYPPDFSGQPTISSQSVVNKTPVNFINTPPVSLLPDGPIDAGSAEERIIVMFSGQLQWPNSSEVPGNSTVAVGIYLDGSPTPAYSIVAFVPSSGGIFPSPPQPVPFSLFWETPTDGAHEVDIKANCTTATGATATNGSLVLITTPV
jgi:hypothetical protein